MQLTWNIYNWTLAILLSSLKLLVIVSRQQKFTNLVLLLWTLTGALHLSFESPDSTGDFLQSESALHVGLLWWRDACFSGVTRLSSDRVFKMTVNLTGLLATLSSQITPHRPTPVSIPSQACPTAILWYKSATTVQQFTVCSPKTKRKVCSCHV